MGRSKQREMGGGKFKSERQRKFMWAVVPSAARKWAENEKTNKGDWAGARGGVTKGKGHSRKLGKTRKVGTRGSKVPRSKK